MSGDIPRSDHGQGAAGAPGMERWRELLRSATGRRALELGTRFGGKEGDLVAKQ